MSVFCPGLGAAVVCSVSSGGGGGMGNGGCIDATLLTLGVEGTTGVVRAGCIACGTIFGLLTIGVDYLHIRQEYTTYSS